MNKFGVALALITGSFGIIALGNHPVYSRGTPNIMYLIGSSKTPTVSAVVDIERDKSSGQYFSTVLDLKGINPKTGGIFECQEVGPPGYFDVRVDSNQLAVAEVDRVNMSCTGLSTSSAVLVFDVEEPGSKNEEFQLMSLTDPKTGTLLFGQGGTALPTKPFRAAIPPQVMP